MNEGVAVGATSVLCVEGREIFAFEMSHERFSLGSARVTVARASERSVVANISMFCM